jgi:C_GCAxxG_C_C family probable redox protein
MEASSIPDVRKSAEESFSSGLFCAESVILSIAKAQGIESELFPRIATAFCSGMARSCGTCGALTGAIMAVSLVLGRSAASESVEACYAATRRVIREFESAFGSRHCQALLDGCDLNTPEGQRMFKEQNLGARCLLFTGRAAEIAAQVIVESDR